MRCNVVVATLAILTAAVPPAATAFLYVDEVSWGDQDDNALLAPTVGLSGPAVEPLASAAAYAGCELFVEAEATRYGGRILDTQRVDVAVVTTKEFPYEASRLLPLFILDEAGQPVPAGFARERFSTVVPVALTVRASWQERFIDWEPIRDRVRVTLAVGQDLLASGDGRLVEVCGDESTRGSGEVDLDFGESDHDFLSYTRMEDGWTADLLSLRVDYDAEGSVGLPAMGASLTDGRWSEFDDRARRAVDAAWVGSDVLDRIWAETAAGPSP